ncbi:MAG: hypothetical protein ACE5DK_02140 [Paracoccaceae bacterium]
MALTKEHALHKRRARRNLFLGLVLGGFVVLIFAITMAKLKEGQKMEGFDHTLRPALAEPGQ